MFLCIWGYYFVGLNHFQGAVEDGLVAVMMMMMMFERVVYPSEVTLDFMSQKPRVMPFHMYIRSGAVVMWNKLFRHF